MYLKNNIIETFYIESLGCPKNSVDSRSIAELLMAAGKKEVEDPQQADLILVNTCGFIQPAVDESLSVLNEFAGSKRADQILIAAGCLSEREKANLFDQVPNLDAAFGTRRWAEVLRLVEDIEKGRRNRYAYFPQSSRIMDDPPGIIRAVNMGGSAYLKIADGCNRGCAFCAIPFIKGPLVSRLLEDVIRDAKILEQAGVQEVILIAQDITTYGSDLGMQDGIVLLLEKLLTEVPEILWVRLMYTFPGSISDDLIQLMAEEQRILNYLDIPLQHAHPEVLKRMHRPSNMAAVKDRIIKIRSIIPDLAVRSTFITGFPDESDEEFIELYRFIEDIRFDHVGFFPYYHEPNTPAYSFVDLPQTVKDQRLQQLAALQEGISLQINQKFVGETLDVLFEGSGDGISVGRSYRDAPEIDGLVILNEIVDNGKIIPVRITGALVHDLLGERI